MTATAADKRIVLITGSSRGIGAGIARAFKKEGWYVIGTDIVEPTSEVTDALDEHHHLDVSNTAVVKALVEQLTKTHTYLTCLVNNAGMALPMKAFEEYTDAEFDRVMAVNLRGPFVMAREFLSMLAAAAEGSASIVNMSSVTAQAAMYLTTVYASSKGGLSAMTRTMALELAPKSIRCNAICPGYIDTSMMNLEHIGEAYGLTVAGMTTEQIKQMFADNSMVKRPGTPDDIGHVAVFLADHTKSSFFTGQCIVADGGQLVKM